MARKKRSIVGYPLTPDILAELDALGPLPPSGQFVPAGNWSNMYQIWSCHGYRESGNEARGHLRIERTAGPSNDSFRLQVHQDVRNDGDAVNVLKADITCRSDTLATPIKWQISSTFQDAQGQAIPELATTQTGKVEGNGFTIETNGKIRRGQSTKALTGDWCLLEAVQRMPFSAQACWHMDVLEEMCLLQRDHRISYLKKNLKGKR